eukprot:179274-Amphidinium_carterae.2
MSSQADATELTQFSPLAGLGSYLTAGGCEGAEGRVPLRDNPLGVEDLTSASPVTMLSNEFVLVRNSKHGTSLGHLRPSNFFTHGTCRTSLHIHVFQTTVTTLVLRLVDEVPTSLREPISDLLRQIPVSFQSTQGYTIQHHRCNPYDMVALLPLDGFPDLSFPLLATDSRHQIAFYPASCV